MTSNETSNISLDLLRTLITFAELGKVELAAQRLKITQAAVSLQLKKLEGDLNVPLFKILGRKKVLTKEAQNMVSLLQPVMKNFEETLKTSLRQSQNPNNFNLRIGCRPELIKKIIPFIQYKGPVQFKALNREMSLKALLEDRIDLAIVQNPPDTPNLIAKVLFQDQVKLVIHKDLLKDKKIKLSPIPNLKDLQPFLLEWDFVSYKEQTPFLPDLAYFLKIDENKFQKKYVCEEWQAVLELVYRFRCWSLMPEYQLTENDWLVIVDLNDSIITPSPFYFVYGKHFRGRQFLNLVPIMK
jgi:DNA-binding transcriptional LysR family regulator